MKLIEIAKHFDSYINTDFITRVWESDDKYYCELLNNTKYQISKKAFEEILKYDTTRIQ